MKPTRRTQPYRKGAAAPAGPAMDAMMAGRTATGHNPQDLKRAIAKRHGKRRRAVKKHGHGQLAAFLASRRGL